jgi:hypothetical protein
MKNMSHSCKKKVFARIAAAVGTMHICLMNIAIITFTTARAVTVPDLLQIGLKQTIRSCSENAAYRRIFLISSFYLIKKLFNRFNEFF